MSIRIVRLGTPRASGDGLLLRQLLAQRGAVIAKE